MSNPSETESQILTTFLLSRSGLSDILSQKTFASFFPKNLRSHPHIKVLYRDLQLQRSLQQDVVRKNIQLEVRMGKKLRQQRDREIEKAKQTADAELADDEEYAGVVDVGSVLSLSKRTWELSSIIRFTGR